MGATWQVPLRAGRGSRDRENACGTVVGSDAAADQPRIERDGAGEVDHGGVPLELASAEGEQPVQRQVYRAASTGLQRGTAKPRCRAAPIAIEARGVAPAV